MTVYQQGTVLRLLGNYCLVELDKLNEQRRGGLQLNQMMPCEWSSDVLLLCVDADRLRFFHIRDTNDIRSVKRCV
jgi:hypothetical protein